MYNFFRGVFESISLFVNKLPYLLLFNERNSIKKQLIISLTMIFLLGGGLSFIICYRILIAIGEYSYETVDNTIASLTSANVLMNAIEMAGAVEQRLIMSSGVAMSSALYSSILFEYLTKKTKFTKI